MISALIFFFYGMVSLVVYIAVGKAYMNDKNVVSRWFMMSFFWMFVSMVSYVLVILGLYGNPSKLAYGMILGRIPLYIGLAYLARVWATLKDFKVPPKTVFSAFLLIGGILAVLHATIWLGRPIVDSGIVAWNIPTANKVALILLFTASFVVTGGVFVLDALREKKLNRLRPALMGVGLLLVGFGGSQISADSIGKAVFFQLFTAIGSVLFVSGILMKYKNGKR